MARGGQGLKEATLPGDTHQAQGLRRLLHKDQPPRVVSILSAAQSNVYANIPARLAQEMAQDSQRTLIVESRAAPAACQPLFHWHPARPLRQQLITSGEQLRLSAPGCQGGDQAIVAAAADLAGEIDFVLFTGLSYSTEEAALDTATPHAIIVLVGDADIEAAYALVKGLSKSQAPIDCLLAGAGARRLSQAIQQILKIPLHQPAGTRQLWHIRDAKAETSSNTLSVSRDLSGYVSKILTSKGPEAHIIPSYASQ